MTGQIATIPKKPTGSFPPLLRLLDTFFSSVDPLPLKLRCLETVHTLLYNIVSNPGNDKYITVKSSNKKFSKDVLQCPGGDLLILEVGFERTAQDMEEVYTNRNSIDLDLALERVLHYKRLMKEAIKCDKEAPSNKLADEKQARQNVVRLIEQNAQKRRYKALRGQPLGGEDSESCVSKLMLAKDILRDWTEALEKTTGLIEPMLPTPTLGHLTEEDFESIYEPAEDSFALLDALQNDRALLNLHRSACPLVLEVGSGSGIISSFIQSSIFESSFQICTDISEHACTITKSTSEKNVEHSNTCLDSVRMSLYDGLRMNNVDLIVFNPPYVPTESSEIDLTGGIAAAWAGGADGMDITAIFLSRVACLLAPKGLLYLVTVARNKPASILAQAASIGLQGRSVLERRAGREKLIILRFHRKLV